MPSSARSPLAKTFQHPAAKASAGTAAGILIANAKAPQYPQAINFILRQNPAPELNG
jgi:hypothetical protein